MIPTHDDIATRAYALWELDGRPPGLDLEYWLQAETELAKADPITPKTATAQDPAPRLPVMIKMPTIVQAASKAPPAKPSPIPRPAGATAAQLGKHKARFQAVA